MTFNKHDYDSKQRFSIRKLSVGVCSVLLSTLFLTMNDNQTVHAATDDGQQETEDNQNQSSVDANRGLNIVTETPKDTGGGETESASQESSTSETSSKSSQTQTLGADSAQKSDDTNKNTGDNTTDTAKISEQKTTTTKSTATDTNNQKVKSLNSDSSASKNNSEEENKSDSVTFNVKITADTDKVAAKMLQESKVAAASDTTTTNGGYDSATWGTLDTSKWTGQNTSFDGTDYYQLTGYTGDTSNIIVPNEADFDAAGLSTNGLQVAISNDLLNQWKNVANTIAFSKTDDKKVKLASNNLNNTFKSNTLTNLDANSLDTSSVTSMQSTFENDTKLSSLNGISDWNVQNVTNMTRIFNNVNQVPDLSPLSNWKTSSLQNLNTAFANNNFTNLQGLENWDVSHVTNMGKIFMDNGKLIDLSALANWDTSNVTDLSMIFNLDSSLTTLNGLENWNTSKVTNLNATFANESALVDASAIANWNTSNVTNMANLFTNSNAQYVDLSKWDFSKVTSASDVIRNIKTVVYLGDNATITANNLNTLGFGSVSQPIILASGALYTLLSGKNSNTHTITIKNSNGGQLTTISMPVVYDASSASDMSDAVNSYKDMIDQKLQDYIAKNNYVIRKVSTDPTDDLTGHNNHLVNYADATYQVVTFPSDQEKVVNAGDKTVYKGTTLTANDLVTNISDFPAGTTFEFVDNSEPNWDKLGTYDVKITATYPVTVNGQQYTAVTAPATAKVTVTDQMQFTITYWDDTENKEIVQFDIKNAGNGAYTQLTFPDGVNGGKYKSIGVSGVPAGATFAGDFWNPFTDPNCNWTVPNYKWDAAAAPLLYGATIVIHLAHRTQDVTNTDPGAQETRTVTADFVKVNEDGTVQDTPFDSATLDVYYIRQATKDLVTGEITYGDWKLNTNKGDNGLQVVSGSWTLPSNSSTTVTVNAPSEDGYVIADTQVDGQSTTSFDVSTIGEDGSKLTTYYVPTSLVEKTVDRVINITPPSNAGDPVGTTSTTKQSATINRPVRVNADDSGIVFDGFDGSGWTTGEWPTFPNRENHTGYTKVITQIVTNPDGTTTETVLNIPGIRPIPSQTVTGDTLPTVINITFTATATATLSGTNQSTYTGDQITMDDINYGTGDDPINVYVIGPISNGYTLVDGDVEFSSDNGQTWSTGLPTDAGTYQLQLTAQGKANIIAQFGNNSIKWVDEDGNSTIGGTATYIINPKSITDVTIAGDEQSKFYDGEGASLNLTGLTISANGTLTNTPLSLTGLTASDFDWYNLDGTKLNAIPTDVGSYEAKLNSIGLKNLQTINSNYSFDSVSGTIKYTINQAEASGILSGSNSRNYDGQATTTAEVNSNGKIGVTVNFPGVTDNNKTYTLKDGDYTWNTDSVPTNAGSYTITLTTAGINNLKNYIVGLTGNGQNNEANVTFADDAFTGSASYIITPKPITDVTVSGKEQSKPYDGKEASLNLTGLTISASDALTNTPLSLTGLTASDFDWYDANGTKLDSAPIKVGDYELRLQSSVLQTLQKNNPNYSFDSVSGTIKYTINQAQASGILSGSNSRTYDGQATTTAEVNSNGKIGVTVNFPGVTDANKTYTLQDGDYTWNTQDGSAPTNAGSYTITLTNAGINNLKNYIVGLTGYGQNNEANVTFAADAFTGSATYTITAAENTVSVDGTQTETYTGQPISVNYNANSDNSVQVSISAKDGAAASLSNVQLDSGDFQIVDVSGNPITAENAGGVYHIVLTADGVTKIQNAVGDNYKISQGTSFGTLVVNKAQASAEFSGNPSYTYTGSANSDYLNGFSIKLNEPNNPTYSLVAGDIEFNVDGTWTTNAPINVGKYDVRLSQAGWDHIKAINSDNVTWAATASSGTGTYTITAATANTELSGHNLMVYNGNAVTTADLYTDGSTIKVTISGNNIVNLPSSFTLEDGDYTWNTQDGKAPVNVGDYTLTLTSAGLNKIQAAIDNAVGEGNVVLSKDNTGSATFQIAQAVSPNVQLDGNEKSEYNGQTVSFDPTNEETKKNFGFNNVQGLTIPDLTADDFEWVDQDGNPISAPTDAGYYYLQLNAQGKEAFATANPNYTFVKDGKSTISGRITYYIYPASLVIGVTGTASEVYNGQNAAITQTQLDNGDIKLVWGNSTDQPIGLRSFTLTPDDLEVVDSAGNPVSHANAQENDKTGNPPYYVRLTSDALNKIKALTGASNYDISLGEATGNFLIYARKAQVTLSGNQTTTYGTDLALDPNAYHIELTNWNSSVTMPTDAEIIQAIGGLKSGDVYINGFTDGKMPTDVGKYQVKISDQLLQRLKGAFPDYDWDAVSGTTGNAKSGTTDANSVDARHEPATYVITPADTTVTINGAEDIKYGEDATIQYGGDNGYSITITAPVKNSTVDNPAQEIYTNLKLETGDLEFVTTPGDVGTYEVKLSAQGLKKLQDLTRSSNYNWTQASAARANFFVNQMPVTITVGGNDQNVTYGSSEWLTDIKKNPQGYTITVKTENGTTLAYQAKDGDLIFSQTPGNVGSYQVVLSAQGLNNIKNALGTNYAYPQVAEDVTTHGNFTVSQGEVTITLNNRDGGDSKTYDSKATTPADLNTGKYNLTYSATVYAPNGTAQTIQLTADDLQFANGDPINAGTYTVELSPAGQAKLKNSTGNNGDNYKWTFNTQATYTINAATDASASLSGSNQMIFNGSAVTTAEINNGGDIIANLTFPGSTKDSIYHLQDGDYTWNTQGGKAPENAGKYTITLTEDGLKNIQAAIDKYAGQGNVTISADKLTGSATFEIVPKPITDVTISGKDQEKPYDGQAASLEVKDLTISANGLVANNPLSMVGITASDFDWYDADENKLDAVPTNAGTYEVRLKDSVLQTLQKDNPNYSFNTASGTIKYTIKQKAATDTLGGNDDKVYNGQGTSVSDVLNSITWTPSGLVDGQSLDLSKLSEADYAWYTKNADGTYTEMTGLPTDAGTYYLKLKDSSIAKIQAANPNYSFATGAISGEYTYVIKKANADVSISGSQTTKDLAINSGNYSDSVKTNNDQTLTIPQLTADDFVVVTKDGQKIKVSQLTEAGTYNVELSEESIKKIREAHPNYDIKFSSTATFILENSSQTINYVDADGNVISSTEVGGKINGDQVAFTPEFPAGWVAIDPSSVPNEITLENGTTTIEIKHDTTNVDHTNPVPDGEKTVTGALIAGAHENDLNQTITRTIVVTNPDGTTQTITQEAKIYRDATYDNVTGKVTYGEWSTAKWDAYTPKNIPGYTVSESSVPEVEIKNGQKDVTVNITYTANEQSGKISYQDETGNEIGSTTITGKTGETIAVTPEVPAGWEIVPGQEIPATVTATADGIPTVVIKIKHGTTNVDHTNPVPDGEKTVTGEVIDGAHESDLNQTITRTIVVTNPDGTKQTITQEAKIYRDATYDNVTGKVTYGEWSTAKWDVYTPKEIPGYTINIEETVDGKTNKISSINEVTVTDKTKDTTIDVTYVPEPQPTEPVQPTTPPTPEEPSEPTNPSGPTEPVQPTKPVKPSKPAKPSRPAKPNKPSNNKDTNGSNKPSAEKRKHAKHGYSDNTSPKSANLNGKHRRNAQENVSAKGENFANNVKPNANNISSKVNKKAELPQTGEQSEGIAAWLGMLLASLGIFSFIGDKKRKKK